MGPIDGAAGKRLGPDFRSMIGEQQRSAILIGSFWMWCCLLSFPLMTLDGGLTDNQILLYQIVGLLQYSTIAVVIYPSRVLDMLSRYNYFQIAVMAIICLSLGLQLHGGSTLILVGIAYTIMLIMVIMLLSLIWTMGTDAAVKCFRGTAVVSVAFAVSAIVVFGWPSGREVGGIHPNLFGAILLSAFVFSQFCKGAAMFLLRAVCLVLAGVVSARFALIGCLIALVVFEATFKPISSRPVILAALAGTCLVLFPQQFSDVLALNDPARNMDSGFTGRADFWNSAFEAMANNPFGVGFKRPPIEEAGHNGYLKALLEFGVFGGGLIIVAMLCILVLAVLEAVLHSGEGDGLRRIASARAAGLVALAFASFFQPQIFNFGDVHGISFILLLFSPGLRLATMDV